MADDLLIRAALRDELSGPVKGIRHEVEQLRAEVARTDRSTTAGARSMSDYGLGFNRTRRMASALTGSLLRVAKVGIGAVSTAAAGAVYGIVRVGTAYEKSVNTFAAVTQASGKQMDAVREKAKLLGADMRLPATSASDAAAAMTELAKGGLSVEGAMRASLGTLQLAGAAQVDAATAAQIQSAALNQFNLPATRAGQVADVLANSANAAAGEVTDMAVALQYVGPVANAAGVGVGDTGTAIGLLAKNGLIGQKAGTGLRGMIAGLLAPSGKARLAIEALGIQVLDSKGRFVGLASVTDQLAQSRGRMTKAEFTAQAAIAFGRENLSAANALAQEGATGWDRMSKAVNRAGGAEAVAAAKTRGLAGAWEGMKSQLETAGIEIYERAAPALEHLIRLVANRFPAALDTALGWLDRFSGRWQTLTEVVAGGNTAAIADALDAFLGGTGITVGPLTTLIDVGRDLWTLLTQSLGPAIGDVAGLLPSWTTPLGIAAGLLGVLADHTGAVRVGVILLIGVYAAYKLASLGIAAADKAAAAASWVKTVADQASGKVTKANTALTIGQRVAVLAASAATKAWAATQWLLNAAMSANPLALVVLALVAVAAGIYLAYRRSETFREVVGRLWNGVLVPFGKWLGGAFLGFIKMVAKAWLFMGEYGVKAFRLLLTAAFAVFGGILDAAEKGLGWVPGLGDKIRTAKASFNAFGDATINKLKGVEKSLHDTRDAVDRLGEKKVVIPVSLSKSRFDVSVVARTAYVGGGDFVTSGMGQIRTQSRAEGGWITGSTGPRADRELVWASPTEFMMRSAVATENARLMEWLNNNGARPLTHADLAGAPVGSSARATAPAPPSVPVSAGGGGGVIVEAGGVTVHVGVGVEPGDVYDEVLEALADFERDREERT